MRENDLNIPDKFCPVCKNKNEREAIICIHCGASLENYFTDSARTTRNTEPQAQVTNKLEKLSIDEAMVPVGEIAICVVDASNTVFFSSDKEFVIGRKIEGTSETILDLSKLGAYLLGLSRRHAIIRRAESGYEVIDLSSTNGTWLNEERLRPNKPYPLTSGSQLRLGRMRFLILYRDGVETKEKA